jgi:hypothetical protein
MGGAPISHRPESDPEDGWHEPSPCTSSAMSQEASLLIEVEMEKLQ